MKIETKFNVGDRVMYDGSVYTIGCIHWNSDAGFVKYTLDSAAHWRHAEESKLSLAPRYSIGDKVWTLASGSCYQMRVVDISKDFSGYKLEHPAIEHVFRKESELYPTKESLLASIQCHELS